MAYIAPTGPVYQAGTLSGNPVAMSAGLAALNTLKAEGNEAKLNDYTARLAQGFQDLAQKHQIPLTTNQVGGMFGFFFTEAKSVSCFAEVQQCDIERFKKFFHLMLEEGIYLAPSAFEASFTLLPTVKKN